MCLGYFALLVKDRSLLSSPANDLQALLHGRIARRRSWQRRRREEVKGHAIFPNGFVHGAVDSLVLRREQRFDLLVGLINRPHASGFFVCLAAHAQSRFGKTLLLALRFRRRAHARTPRQLGRSPPLVAARSND